MSARITFAVMMCLGVSSAAAQETPAAAKGKLAGEPTVAKVAGGYEIAFALTAPSDVTVRIVDAKGEVIRHLASGMVGLEKAAAPLAANSLAQKVLWDGKDDAGKAAPAGPCRVKIGVGLTAKFEKFILDGHDTFLSNISAFGGSNRTGHVFVSNYGFVITNFMKEFDRDGRYVKTIWPPNPNMPRDLLEAFWKTDRSAGNSGRDAWKFGQKDYEGRTVLLELHGNSLGGPQIGSIAQVADGRIIATRAKGGEGGFEVWDSWGRMMEGIRFVPWSMENRYSHVRDTMNICSDLEGRFVYVTDAGRRENKGDTGYIVACLDATTLKPFDKFRYSGLKKLDAPRYYLGTLNEPGDDESHFTGATGTGMDGHGRFWVADASCVKVFDPEGRFLKRIDAHTPGFEKVPFANLRIGADSRTGAVYLATGMQRARRTLYKIESYDNPAIVWQAEMPPLTGTADRNSGQIFVDGEAKLVWVSEGAGKLTLLRVEDKGKTFETKAVNGLVDGKLLRPQYMRVDAKGDLFVMDHARQCIVRSDVDGRTWKEIVKSSWDGSSGWFCVDAEGNVYLADAINFARNYRLRKFDADGKPLPIGAFRELVFTDRPPETEWGAGRITGVCVAASGDIYVAGVMDKVRSAAEVAKASKDVAHDINPKGVAGWVNVYGADGALKKSRLVRLVGPNDVALGRDGIYTVEAGIVLSPAKRNWGHRNNIPWTANSKLQKYTLTGGIEDGEGHLWDHRGVGYVNSISCSYECPGAQLCVDDDDLIWTTEHMVYNVKAVDSAGNLVARIGTYGNADCDGEANGKNPAPAIPLTWPVAVARYRDLLLIADQVSARILRCRLEYSQTKELPFK